ncbi:hypothetical protein JCM13210_08070 [Thermaerobacter litoralis]
MSLKAAGRPCYDGGAQAERFTAPCGARGLRSVLIQHQDKGSPALRGLRPCPHGRGRARRSWEGTHLWGNGFKDSRATAHAGFAFCSGEAGRFIPAGFALGAP